MEIKQHIQKNKLSNVKYGEKKINNINKKVWFGIIKIDS